MALNQFDPWCLQVEQAFDASHFILRRIPTLPLAVRLHMCLTAGDELCFQRGDDGRKGGGMYCLCLFFFFSFLRSALVFIFCSMLFATCRYIHTHTGLLCSQNSELPIDVLFFYLNFLMI